LTSNDSSSSYTTTTSLDRRQSCMLAMLEEIVPYNTTHETAFFLLSD
jgi:hypothetical protein